MKKVISAILALALLLTALPAMTAESGFAVVVNGAPVYFGGALPYDNDGTAMVPVYPVAGAMGLGFSWYPTLETAFLSDGISAVELTPGQIAVRLSGSTFIADEAITLDSFGRLYISASTMTRLAEYFGFDAEMEDDILTVSSAGNFSLTVNDRPVSFTEFDPVVRGGETYLPLVATADAMGLDLGWDPDSLTATVATPDRKSFITLKAAGDALASVFPENSGDGILYEDNRIFISAGQLISIAAELGGAASYNYYGNGLIISTDKPYNVLVNGILTVFPDEKPANSLIPLRPVAETLGLVMTWDSETGGAELASGESKASIIPDATELMFSRGNKSLASKPEQPPVMVNNRLMVSPDALLMIADFFELEAEENDNLITIIDPAAKPYDPSDFQPVRTTDSENDENAISVELDGGRIAFPDVQPFSVDGRTLIPVRTVAENMKLDVEWDGGDGVIISNGSDRLELSIGSDKLTGVRGGKKVESRLDVAAVSVNGRTCVPIRAIMEFFGATVLWDSNASLVRIITSRQSRVNSDVPAADVNTLGTELGFTIKAPPTGSDTSLSIVNGNTARVRFYYYDTYFIFDATYSQDSPVIRESDFVGPTVNIRTTINGVPTRIYSGATAFSTQAACWSVGAYSFSLEAESPTSVSILTEAESAAKTFVIVKEVEPEDVRTTYSADLPYTQVDGSSFFRDMGISMTVPVGSDNMDFRIYDNGIAEITFRYEGYSYTLRAAENGGSLSGLKGDPDQSGTTIAITSSSGGTIGTLFHSVDGGKVGTWSWGSVNFSLSCTNSVLPIEEFEYVCGLCGELSSSTLMLYKKPELGL